MINVAHMMKILKVIYNMTFILFGVFYGTSFENLKEYIAVSENTPNPLETRRFQSPGST